MSNADRKRYAELVAEVDAADLIRAQKIVAKAVQTARDAWLPSHLIAEALLLELESCITTEDQHVVANFLRNLADAIDRDSLKKVNYH